MIPESGQKLMKRNGFLYLFFTLMLGVALSGNAQTQTAPEQAPGSWYFAVSGDSRDCGDLIMPKIAKSIESLRDQTPVQFYWHLGDFRRMYDIDCDILKRKYPAYDCKARPQDALSEDDINNYLNNAWDDFIQHQLLPFGKTPVFLGIGNHELYANRTRDDFRKKFQKWLAAQTIHAQRAADISNGTRGLEGDTYYHFVKNGIDFISLDNADQSMFDSTQIVWLSKVLAADVKNDSIKTIIAGTHEALPFSNSRGHAMDSSCQGICSGKQVYDLLFDAQNLSAPIEKQKHVYLMASHAHDFRENVFDTPEHHGQILPGWIVGTAGAEQNRDSTLYGYILVEVRPDGTINPQFKEVTRESPPLAEGQGADELTAYCFERNVRGRGSDESFKGDCSCGANLPH